MYEGITYEVLIERMLETALAQNKKLDSREGSLLWYGQAPAAVELQNLYIALDTVLQETFADTATRPYLIQRAAERHIVPLEATPAILQMTITPASLNLPMNTRFSIGQVNYFISEDMGGGNYAITCETAGEAGNDYSGTVIPIEYVEGLETCTITALLIPGEDEEDTEVFRQRYIESLNTQAFGGNQIDYIQRVNAIPGIGGVRVYRVWNNNIQPASMIPPTGTAEWIAALADTPDEIKLWLQTVFQAASNSLLTVGGTVKLVIIDSEFNIPSAMLVDQVQTAIDPIQNAGEGVGLAPIGHVVKVEGVAGESINLALSLSYREGWTWNDVEPYVREILNDYFTELAETWADQEEPLIVRISQIESRLLGVAGILDIADTTINDMPENYTLQPDCIPKLGTITASTM